MMTICETYKTLSGMFRYPEDKTLQREYHRLFSLTVAGGIPPYETEYGHKEIFFKTDRLADIAGFYLAFGMEVVGHERVDHIGAELELMHWLTLKEEKALLAGQKEPATICRSAAEKFMKDHLGRWGAYFGDQIAKSSSHPFYQRAGRELSRFLESECRRLGVKPEQVTNWTPEPLSATEFECGVEAGCKGEIS